MQKTKFQLCLHQLTAPEPCIYLMSLYLHLQVWIPHPQHAKHRQNTYLQVKD